MQAISSDIIVNQSLQSTDLLISQNNNTNSSSSVSFAEMLDSYKQSSDDSSVKTVEKNPDEKVYKNESSEKTETSNAKQEPESVEENKISDTDKEKNEVSDSENKVSKADETSRKSEEIKSEQNSVSDRNIGKSIQSIINEKNVEKTVSDQVKNTEKSENAKKTDAKVEKKLSSEIDRLNQFLEEAAQEITSDKTIQPVSMVLNDGEKISKQFSNKFENDEESVKVENALDLSSLKTDESNPFNEKITAFDKDGKIVVRDQRTEQPESQEKTSKLEPKLVTDVQINEDNTATVTMNLANETDANVLSLNNQTATSNGSDFQAMVSNQIQNSAPEFVKAGSILLKDNDKGTINLVLRPDDIGSVKIQLSMDGKTVNAHITVNTKEALEVFKDNAQTLREAFANSGFDTGNFDVSYNGQSNNQNQGFESPYDGTEYIARHAYGESGDGLNSGYIQDYMEKDISEYSINIVA